MIHHHLNIYKGERLIILCILTIDIDMWSSVHFIISDLWQEYIFFSIEFKNQNYRNDWLSLAIRFYFIFRLLLYFAHNYKYDRSEKCRWRKKKLPFSNHYHTHHNYDDYVLWSANTHTVSDKNIFFIINFSLRIENQFRLFIFFVLFFYFLFLI